jgi:PadR family transcriptional regulator, regulatory protein PadR
MQAMGRSFLTYTSGLVLEAIAAGHRYGFDVMDVTGLPSGTVYPAMRKLERIGMVRSSWEQDKTAWREQRPARRYYEITASGAEALQELRKRFHGLQRAVAPAAGA